jgi:hypothetical protein
MELEECVERLTTLLRREFVDFQRPFKKVIYDYELLFASGSIYDARRRLRYALAEDARFDTPRGGKIVAWLDSRLH